MADDSRDTDSKHHEPALSWSIDGQILADLLMAIDGHPRALEVVPAIWREALILAFHVDRLRGNAGGWGSRHDEYLSRKLVQSRLGRYRKTLTELSLDPLWLLPGRKDDMAAVAGHVAALLDIIRKAAQQVQDEDGYRWPTPTAAAKANVCETVTRWAQQHDLTCRPVRREYCARLDSLDLPAASPSDTCADCPERAEHCSDVQRLLFVLRHHLDLKFDVVRMIDQIRARLS